MKLTIQPFSLRQKERKTESVACWFLYLLPSYHIGQRLEMYPGQAASPLHDTYIIHSGTWSRLPIDNHARTGRTYKLHTDQSDCDINRQPSCCETTAQTKDPWGEYTVMCISLWWMCEPHMLSSMSQFMVQRPRNPITAAKTGSPSSSAWKRENNIAIKTVIFFSSRYHSYAQ